MSLLSKQAETKLIGAIENAAALVNSGMAPNAAIIKSATDNAVPPGHIDLMVHAYNTGRTTKQREQGDSTLEKAADFPLANVDEIKSALFGQNVKTSAEIKAQHAVSPEYALNPTAMIKRANNPTIPAAAPFVPTFVRPPRDEHEQVRREYSQKRAAHWAVEEQRRQVSETYQKAAAKFDELLTYFRTPGHIPFADAMTDVRLVHGEQGVAVMQKLANMYPTFEKEAAKNYRILTDVTARNLVGEVLDLVSTYNDLNTAYAEKTASAKNQVEKKVATEITTGSILFRPEDVPLTLKQAGIDGLDTMRLREAPTFLQRITGQQNPESYEQKVMEDPDFHPTFAEQQLGLLPGYRPFGARSLSAPTTPRPNSNSGSSSKPSTPFQSVTNILTPAKVVGGIMGLGSEDAGKAKTDIKGKSEYNTLSDPGHDETIKNIRAKSVLHDLILNDPIISGHDPQDVAMAFNDVAELAPNLVDTPGMLQTVLRKRLESGQLADFDVKQILEMDKLRAERDKIQGEARRINMETM